MKMDQYITLLFSILFTYVLMAYIFESGFQTTRYKEHRRGLSIKKGDHPELSFKFNHSPEVRKLDRRAALVVEPADTLHGHLDVTSRTNFHIRAASIFLEGLLHSLIFSHTRDIEICLFN